VPDLTVGRVERDSPAATNLIAFPTRPRPDGDINPNGRQPIMFNATKRRSVTKPLSVTIDGETLNFTYRPASIDPKLIDSFAALGDAKGGRPLVEIVVQIVADWEIGDPILNGHTDDAGNRLQATDENGTPLWDRWPVDIEHAERLDMAVHNAVIEKVLADLKPGESTAGGSLVG
jgi:hypothetical protein